MKNKSEYIRKLMSSLAIVILLCSIFIQADRVRSKIIILPFLICGLAMFGQVVFLMMGRPKAVQILKKVYVGSFLLFYFGFLSLWCFLCAVNQNYLLAVISIPFWFIGLFLIHTFLTGKKPQRKNRASGKSALNQRGKLPVSFKSIIGPAFIGICFIIGLTLLYFGISGTIYLKQETAGYIETEGYFSDYSIYSADENSTTYQLIYSYSVRGKEYTVSTPSGTHFIPKKGSIRTVRYHPDYPEKAVIRGTGNPGFLLFMGFLFTVVPAIMVLAILSVSGRLHKIRIDFIGLSIGLTFILLSFGALYLLTGTFSILKMFQSYSNTDIIPLLILVLLLAVGIYLVIKSLLTRKKSPEKK